MSPVVVAPGEGPVVLAFPHTGTHLPGNIADRLNANGRLLADTDWHVERLYAGVLAHATTVRATFHRYVIDANRDPTGASMYPGQHTTGLVPVTDFDGQPIWRKGAEPDEGDIGERIEQFHAPYHRALAGEIERVAKRHGVVVLYDCHSIRSRIPFLFEGVLPDCNIGTFNGASCAPEIAEAALNTCLRASRYTSVLNGRFKGGWTTRRYGDPSRGVHAIQMELAQSTYLQSEAPPFACDDAKARDLRRLLGEILEQLDALARSGRLTPSKEVHR
jgi:formiminoglutamase